MIPAWVRIVAAVPFTAAGIALFAVGSPGTGAVVTGLGVLLLLAWVRYSDVPRAARAYGLGDRERAWALLAKVPFGGRLLATPLRVYYHQVRASCLLKWERWEEAARESEAALALRGTDEQKASSHAAAALACVEMGDDEGARRHYAAAQALPHGEILSRRLARLATRLGGGAAAPDVTGA
jgi:hypothetical protein